MGTVTITPQFSDYTNGSTWATVGGSLGLTPTGAYQLAIQQACLDLSNGLTSPAGNLAFIIDYGYGAYGSFPGASNPGVAVPSGAASGYASSTYTYAQVQAKLVAIASPNSFQSGAWSGTNLPSSTPAVILAASPYRVQPPMEAAIGLASLPVGNPVLGCVGFSTGGYNDTDLHGLGAGKNVYGGAMHETTEMLGRLDPSSFWAFTSAATRFVPNGSTTSYFSVDNGSTNLAGFDTGGGSTDSNDYTLSGDAFNAFTQTGPVSRSSILPLSQFDWQLLTTLGFGLTVNGLIWAGISSPTRGFMIGKSI